jgi:hypothetical protein
MIVRLTQLPLCWAEATNARPTSRENLARLNHQGFLYMSADLYNELVRRQASGNAAPDTGMSPPA